MAWQAAAIAAVFHFAARVPCGWYQPFSIATAASALKHSSQRSWISVSRNRRSGALDSLSGRPPIVSRPTRGERGCRTNRRGMLRFGKWRLPLAGSERSAALSGALRRGCPAAPQRKKPSGAAQKKPHRGRFWDRCGGRSNAERNEFGSAVLTNPRFRSDRLRRSELAYRPIHQRRSNCSPTGRP